jgi:hypothetical protein
MLGCALLLYGGNSLGFTLIAPEEQTSPSSSVTESTTLKTQVQPIAGAIHTQMLNLRRHKRSRNVAQFGRVLVASAEADGRGGFGPLAAALKEPAAAGGASGGGAATGLWISATANSLENEFSRTAFDGASHNLLAGFDVTHSNRYVFGLAVGHEASNYTTTFNVGNEKTRGFNVTPYVAFLLSDSWSLDLSGGYGDFDTRQTRTVVARGAAVAGGALGVVLAIVIPSVIASLTAFYAVLGVSLFVPVVAGLHTRRPGVPEALAAVGAGVAALLAARFAALAELSPLLDPTLVGIVTSGLAFGAVFVARVRWRPDSIRA